MIQVFVGNISFGSDSADPNASLVSFLSFWFPLVIRTPNSTILSDRRLTKV